MLALTGFGYSKDVTTMRSAWRRARGLQLVVLVGVLWATVCSASATAAVIPGNPLQIFMDGSGHLQVRLHGYAEGELQPANLDLANGSGMTFTMYHPGGAAAKCGAAGNPVRPVSGPTPVTGAGTVTSPYEMSTSYLCDLFGSAATIKVTQTFSYVNGDTGFAARYAVSNPGTGPVRFRAFSRGVFAAAGSGQGQGFLEGESPRVIGMFNDEQGSEGGFVETASTPWSRYVEGSAQSTSIFTNEEDSFGAGLINTVDPSLVADPRVAVQFDRYTSFGLAAGASDTYDVQWFFAHYGGLSLTPSSGSQTVGRQQSVTAVSLDHGQPVSRTGIRYAITGANASSGSVTTAADGTATITWVGTQPGQDTLTAYADNDGNAAYDPAIDTQQTGTFSWTAPPPPPPPLTPAVQPTSGSRSAPSNRFAVVAANAGAGGVITLTLRAPGPGAVQAVATSTRSANRTFPYGKGRATARRAGRIKLKIRPTHAAKRRLRHRRLKVTVAVTFKPTGSTSQTRRRVVVVKANRRR
jgi:hypothetical protein